MEAQIGPTTRFAFPGMKAKEECVIKALGPTTRLAYGMHPNAQTDRALSENYGPQVCLGISSGLIACEAMVKGLTDPTVRLATTPEGAKTKQAYMKAFNEDPNVRLALANGQAERNGTLETPTNRLVMAGGGGPQSPGVVKGLEPTHADILARPALLVSYVYLRPFLNIRHKYCYRDWVMDSGAFSAHASGEEIDLQAYIDKCKELLATDPTLTEVFALDDIGDWKKTIANTEEMWKQGVPAIPAYHFGEPWDVLKVLARDYPKIALGGVARKNHNLKLKWAGQCFARIWPKPVHGFGFGTEEAVMGFPFHSTDATNWELGPCGFGKWKSYGDMSVRGSAQNLRVEVEWYLKLERKARDRWAKEMKVVNDMLGSDARPLAMRLALAKRDTDSTQRFEQAFADPSVRLADATSSKTFNGGKEQAFNPPKQEKK